MSSFAVGGGGGGGGGDASPGTVVIDEQVLTEVDVSELPPAGDDDDASIWTEAEGDADERIPDDDMDMDEEGEGEGEGEGSSASESAVYDAAHVVFRGHSDYVYSAGIHPTRPGVAITGGGDDKAFLWTYESGSASSSAGGTKMLSSIELTGHTDTVTCVGFNFDGSMVMTGSYDGSIRVWDATTGALQIVLEGPEDIEWANWHSKGNAIVAGSKDGTIWMWLTHNGQCVQVFAGHDGPVSVGCFSSDGKVICSGGEDGTVRLWAPKTGVCKHVFDGKLGHEAAVTCIASDEQDPELLATGSIDGTIKLFHLGGKRVLQQFVHCKPEDDAAARDEAAPREALYNDDGEEIEGEQKDVSIASVECVGIARGSLRWLASGGMDKTLKIWDTTNGTCRSVCMHPGGVVALKWHALLPVVCTGCLDNSVRLWDARNGTMLAQLTGHRDQVTFLDIVTGALDTIISVSDDGTARIFEVSTAALL